MHKFALNQTTGAITYDSFIPLTRVSASGDLVNVAQGIEWWRDHYWMTDDSRDEVMRIKANGDWHIDDCPIQFSDNSATSVTGNYEGIAVYKDGLAVLVDPSSANSYLIYSRPANFDMGGGGVRYGTNNGYLQATGLTGGTVFTMAVSAARSTAKQAALATFRDFSAGATNDRVTLSHRFVSPNYRIEVWDNLNTWLSPATPVNALANTWNRVATVYNGTARHIYINGTLQASQSGITARDAGFTAFTLGHDDETDGESFDGDLSFAYIRMGTLGATWLGAEHAMLSNPAGFYSIAEV